MIINPLFQSLNWQTAPSGDPRGPGNQIPSGWTLVVTPQGQLMPWPTKGARDANGAFIILDAEAGGPGEYVHKLAGQLPINELFGTPRALLVLPNTNKIYKGFGGVPHAFALSQKLTETPGMRKQYLLYILAETSDSPTPPHADLEPDHFRVRFAVGGVTVESHYADMRGHRAVPGNERAWNVFDIPSFEFPASGEAQMVITCQKNWPGLVDFFVAGVVEQTIGGPGDGGNPPPDLNILTNLVTGLEGDVDLSERVNVMLRARMDAIKTEMVRRRGG